MVMENQGMEKSHSRVPKIQGKWPKTVLKKVRENRNFLKICTQKNTRNFVCSSCKIPDSKKNHGCRNSDRLIAVFRNWMCLSCQFCI